MLKKTAAQLDHEIAQSLAAETFRSGNDLLSSHKNQSYDDRGQVIYGYVLQYARSGRLNSRWYRSASARDKALAKVLSEDAKR